MSLENSWVGYISRSYVDIKQSLKVRLKSIMTEITDFTESNIVMVILDSMSGLLEQLHYYIDNKARESFVLSARRWTSMVKITRILDYRIKASSGAYADLYIQTLDNSGNPFNVSSPIIIGKGTRFLTSAGIVYTTIKEGVIKVGTNHTTILSRQMDKVVDEVRGVTNGNVNQTISLPDTYLDDTLEVVINGIIWNRKNTFGFSSPTDKDFIVDVSEDKVIQMIFGNSLHGEVPPISQNVVTTYYTTQGILGRVLENELTIWDIIPSLVGTGASSITVTNLKPSVSGTGVQTIEDIRREAPISFRVLESAVTIQDFIDMALLVPGVDKSGVKYTSDRGLEIFIAPVGGGTANASLTQAVLDFFDKKVMIPFDTSSINVKPAGETLVVLGISITGEFRKTSGEISQEVLGALLNGEPFSSMGINSTVKLSNINAEIESLSTVDYLYIDSIYAIPYPRPSNTLVDLVWTISLTPQCTTTSNWILYYNNPDFQLFKNGSFIRSLSIGELIDMSLTEGISFTIQSGDYTTGGIYEFTTYPYGKNIEIKDNTVPIVKTSSITLNITEVF